MQMTGQRSFDDLETPLADVTFCVLDIETTGSDSRADLITEVGAVKVRGGECLGTLATLVNPGQAIPPTITYLTGITDAMVCAAPRIEAVLPSLIGFIGDAVVVGHNVGFDVSFINAALHRRGDPPLAGTIIDTLALARRLVREDVPDCRLGTLAARLRLDHRPTHRAFDDALATADLLHRLLERAGGWGVLGLDDLVALPRLAGHPQVAKLRLTIDLPRGPGVYVFHGAAEEVLYVGKASNLRQRVRSYFGSDDRRKIGPLLRETRRISHVATSDPVSAEVLEMRYLHLLAPRYNHVGTTWRRSCYVRLSTDEAWPRLSIVADAKATGIHLGPVPSRAVATAIIDAIQSVVPLRRCSARLGRAHIATPGSTPCSAAQLGTAMCPCAGDAEPRRYEHAVAMAAAAMTDAPHIVLDPLWQRIEVQSDQRRYEEAGLARDRARAFTAAMQRQRLGERLRAAGDIGVQIGATELHLANGVLVSVRADGQLPLPLPLAPPPVPPLPSPLPRDAADEVLCLARALDRYAARARLLWCAGEWCQPRIPVREVVRLPVA